MISPEPNAQPAGGPIEFWHILRRRKRVLILFACSCSGAATGYLLTVPQTPIYQARTSIEIAGLNDNFLNTKQVKPVTETGSSSEMADLQTQIKILLSESLLGRVLDKLAGQFPLPALKNAQKEVKVHGAGQSRILEIGVDSADPAMAAKFANTLAGEFISQNLEARRKTTHETSRWLNQQLEHMRLKLERSEAR